MKEGEKEGLFYRSGGQRGKGRGSALEGEKRKRTLCEREERRNKAHILWGRVWSDLLVVRAYDLAQFTPSIRSRKVHAQ